jgi:hypothetical protein
VLPHSLFLLREGDGSLSADVGEALMLNDPAGLAHPLPTFPPPVTGPITPEYELDFVEENTMAETISGKLVEAGNAVAQATKKVVNKVGEKVEEGTNWAREKLHQAENRAEEAAEEKAKEAKIDADAKSGNCGCG